MIKQNMKDYLYKMDVLCLNTKVKPIKKNKYSKDKINCTQNNTQIKIDNPNSNIKQNTPKYDKIKNRTEKIPFSNSKILGKYTLNQTQKQINRNKNNILQRENFSSGIKIKNNNKNMVRNFSNNIHSKLIINEHSNNNSLLYNNLDISAKNNDTEFQQLNRVVINCKNNLKENKSYGNYGIILSSSPNNKNNSDNNYISLKENNSENNPKKNCPKIKITNNNNLNYLTLLDENNNNNSNVEINKCFPNHNQTDQNIIIENKNDLNLLKEKLVRLSYENKMLKQNFKQLSIQGGDNSAIFRYNNNTNPNTISINNTLTNSSDEKYSLRNKILKNMNTFKKNKELSHELENKNKELYKMQNVYNKYMSLINTNKNIQKNYGLLEKKIEVYVQEIDNQQKEIKNKDFIILNLRREISSKNEIIQQKELQLLDLVKQNKKNLNKKDQEIEKTKCTLDEMGEEITKLRGENNVLLKFKNLYNESETKKLELEKDINKYKDVDIKYLNLQNNYDILEKKLFELNNIQNEYNHLLNEYNTLKVVEKKYNELLSKYNDLEDQYFNIKSLKEDFENISKENQNLLEIKKKYEKICTEFDELKEIREKYAKVLTEQKNLIIIENKYNDLMEEMKDLKDIENKYEKLMEEKENDENKYINEINKIKIELNGVIKQKMIAQNNLDNKIKENEDLNKKIKFYQNKYNIME